MPAATQKRVIVIGGGYAGFTLARSLDAAADVVLIEPRERFVHNVAAIRAIVEPGLLARIALPYDRLLHRGEVVRARVLEISGRSVRLSDGRTLDGDVVVIATGSSYTRPFKPVGDDVAAMIAAGRDVHEQLRAARSVAIVGAGAVGTELAGEIAVAMPDKSVTLISSTPTLFPRLPPKLGRKLQTQLESLGVALRLGATARTLPQTDAPFAGTVELNDGPPVEADLVFPALGAKPVTDLLQTLPGVRFDPIGRAEVDGWLRPSTHPHLFALGDAIAAGDGMTIVAVARQQRWLTKTLKAVLAGTSAESLPRYTPGSAPALAVPLGPTKGATVLPITRNGIVVGPLLTSAAKGRTLLIPRVTKQLGRS